MSCSYTFLVEKHTIGLVKFVEFGFVPYILLFLMLVITMCYDGVYKGLGVHEVATIYGATLYKIILLLFLV